MKSQKIKLCLTIVFLFVIFAIVNGIAGIFIAKTAVEAVETDCRKCNASVKNMAAYLERDSKLSGKAPSGYWLDDIGNEIVGKDSKIYLLDVGGNVVTSSMSSPKDFNPNTLKKRDFYVENEDDAKQPEVTKDGEGKFVLFDQNTKLSLGERLNEIYSTLNNFSVIMDNNATIWYKEPLSVGDGQSMSLLVGKKISLSKSSTNMVFDAIVTFVIIISLFFLIFIVAIVSSGFSSRKLRKMAYVDDVTKGNNWNHFRSLVKRRIRKQSKTNYAFVVLATDSYRIISDVAGHKRGSEMLQHIYTTLKYCCTKKEVLGRMFEDHFCMLLSYDTKENLEARIREMDKKIRSYIPVRVVNIDYGIYLVSKDMKSPERMNNYATFAREGIVDNPTQHIAFFDDKVRDAKLKEINLENEMQKALDEKEYKLFLQPKYSTDGKNILGAEALVRWISPSMGFISPGEFIPLFEKNGFVRQLDEYMLSRVCEYQKKCMELDREMITISVNLSRANLGNPKLVEKICEVVDSYAVPHNYIELELTESTFFEGKQILIDTLDKLRKEGFSVSMDDFGSGYSSLNSLKDLPLDVVKLDAGFFRQSDNEGKSDIVVRDTITLAKHLDMKIVAEGIETKSQVDFLKETDCDLIQGFYFAKPMPVNEFEDLISGCD